MPSSTHLQKIEEWAKEYDSKLRADDPRFCRAVTIYHEEGSVLHFRSAFVIKKKNKKMTWYCIFTEHHSFHIYAGDEASVIQFSGEEPIEEG